MKGDKTMFGRKPVTAKLSQEMHTNHSSVDLPEFQPKPAPVRRPLLDTMHQELVRKEGELIQLNATYREASRELTSAYNSDSRKLTTIVNELSMNEMAMREHPEFDGLVRFFLD